MPQPRRVDLRINIRKIKLQHMLYRIAQRCGGTAVDIQDAPGFKIHPVNADTPDPANFQRSFDPAGALLIGLAAGFVCYVSAVWVKRAVGYDDALDAWGVHGVGGALGAILTGVFASSAINPAAKGWLHDGNFHQMVLQFIDVAATFVYCGIVTFLILKLLDMTVGLRVSRDVEIEGLDFSLHGETVHG